MKRIGKPAVGLRDSCEAVARIEEGLFRWWEHSADAASPGLGAHTLVIADHNGALCSNLQRALRFTASDQTLGADSLTRWASVSRVASARVAMRSRDHRSLLARAVEASGGAGSSAEGDVATDRDGRIRVQFHWQRGSASSHRLGAPRGGNDNAPASAASSTWVRVGQSLAGANFGAVFTPRVGQEVLVAFTGGDIDRPVVVGVAYNGRGTADAQGNQVAQGTALASGNAPAWFPGQQPADDHQGHQHGAVLLGRKSQELGSSRSGLGGANQLVFDDSPQASRIELGSTTEATRLQLGALLQQQDNQRLALRGHGLELATLRSPMNAQVCHRRPRLSAPLQDTRPNQPVDASLGFPLPHLSLTLNGCGAAFFPKCA